MENKDLMLEKEEMETLSTGDVSLNNYDSRISEMLGYSKEYMDAMQRNYPDMTREEIIGAIESQKDYDICFHHQHEWISWDLIRKYLILDDFGTDVEKITLETDEIHDCNLVGLTPELQEKSYWWSRWDRSIVSHLIDKEDYPTENKTKKLTIIWKLKYPDFEDYDEYEIEYDYDIDENIENENDEEVDTESDDAYEEAIKPYFYVITAFRWDWSSCPEPKEYYWWYDFQQMEYWMNHALIPETDEHIQRRGRPFRVDEYHKMVEEKKIAELKSFSIKEMYRQLIKGIKSEFGEIDKIEDITMRNCFDLDDIDIDTEKLDRFNKLYFILHSWEKFWVIEVNIPYIILNKDEYEDDWTPQIVLDKNMTESDILDIDFRKNFEINVIKDIDKYKEIEDEQLIKYRKNFIKRYYKEENFEKIINAIDLFDCKRETDSEWSKITTIKVWNNIYKLMEPNLSNHIDDRYGSTASSWYENISDFRRCEVQLDGMRWDNLDGWKNKKLSEYIKEMKSLWFLIPSCGEFKELLKKLWEMAWLEKFKDQLLLLMYLTWLDWEYWLSMNWEYRDKLKLQNLMLWSNIGNVSSAILLIHKQNL